jgi:hypothetical protein
MKKKISQQIPMKSREALKTTWKTYIVINWKNLKEIDKYLHAFGLQNCIKSIYTT